MFRCYGCFLVLDFLNSIELALLYLDGLEHAIVLLVLEYFLSPGHQSLSKRADFIGRRNLAVLQVIFVAFALDFDHQPQSIEIRLLKYGGWHAEDGSNGLAFLLRLDAIVKRFEGLRRESLLGRPFEHRLLLYVHYRSDDGNKINAESRVTGQSNANRWEWEKSKDE